MRFILRRFAWALCLSVLGNAAAARADGGDDQFAVAAEQYRQQHWQQACDELHKLLADFPDHRRANQARFFYGEALSQLGRWSLAQAQFAELIRRDPADRYARQALFRCGETAYLGGDAIVAKRDLLAFRQRFPDDELNGYALPYLASLELRGENPTAAEQMFAAALEKYPEGPLVDDCHLGLGRARERLGQLDKAREEFQSVAERDTPLADQALLRLGMLDNTRGEYALALVSLERLNKKFPDSPLQADGQLGRGYALFKLQRYAEAEAGLQPLLEKPPQRVEAHYWLGLAQRARGDWPAGAKTLSAGAALDDTHRLAPALAYYAGDTLAHEKQVAEARAQFDRVLKLWPQCAWADDCQLGKLRLAAEQQDYARCVQLADELAEKFSESPLLAQAELAKGQALFALEKYAEAVGPLTSLLKRPAAKAEANAEQGDDVRPAAQATLALAYARLRQFDRAKASLAELRAAKPDGALLGETTYGVAQLAQAADELALARELFAELIQEGQPASVQAGSLAGLAWCEFQDKQWAAAAEHWKKLLGQYPDSSLAPDAALFRGRALEHLEQPQEALAMYRVIVDRYATSSRAAEALWRAARLHDTLGQPTEAMELYGKLIGEHADFAELDAALYRRAWLLNEANQPAEAAELFARVRRDFPNSRFAADTTLRLAERAVSEEKYAEAAKLLAEITTAETPAATREHALYLQGRAAMAAGQWSQAESPLEQLSKDFPDGELALPAAYVMAEASYHLGKFDQAAQRLAALAERTKDRPQSWSATAELRRAQSLAQMKEWSQAIEIAQSIATRFPSFEQQFEVDYLIGRSLAAGADFAAAREAYGRVIASPRGKTTQTAAMAQWMLGESYLHQENYAAALAEYAKVDEHYPFPRWQAAALLQAGKCHEQLGQWRAAADDYDRLLKLYPASEFSAEAASRSAAAQERVAGGQQKLK